jgi:cysteine desulfurase
MIYLDHNATSILREHVREAMREVEMLPLNASSVHAQGRKAKQFLEQTRKQLAEYLSVFTHEITFTASATEANNALLRAYAPHHALLVGGSEHPCVLNTALKLGGDVIAVDENGLIDMNQLEAKLASLSGAPALVSVMLVNNETGVIQPIQEIAKLAKKHGALIHSDAVQAFGKMPIDMGLLGLDMLTISAHKIGGPIGVGALVMRDDKGFIPLLTGGGQEGGKRAGTENIPALIGLGALMAKLDVSAMQAQQKTWQQQRENFLKQIKAHAPDAPVYSQAVQTMPNTIMLGMDNMGSETQLMHFDLAGIAISAGSACSSGRVLPSHVLRAMGLSREQAANAVRVSLGWNTTQDHLDACAKSWLQLYNRLAK